MSSPHYYPSRATHPTPTPSPSRSAEHDLSTKSPASDSYTDLTPTLTPPPPPAYTAPFQPLSYAEPTPAAIRTSQTTPSSTRGPRFNSIYQALLILATLTVATVVSIWFWGPAPMMGPHLPWAKGKEEWRKAVGHVWVLFDGFGYVLLMVIFWLAAVFIAYFVLDLAVVLPCKLVEMWTGKRFVKRYLGWGVDNVGRSRRRSGNNIAV